ncbi:MAG: Asp-tRNA(Asn)/Glu-tRNA(Gln) amidotransferase subunit GatA [Pseudomonadota bacterium]|nr:Asp-tRNA(Asn)/Glu-tRNA(Gln) amidotransferase subunit GatA [Pseudomonadota bacterium]
MHNLSLAELSRQLKQKKISSVELTQLFLDRIHRFNPKINAFISVNDEFALTQAKKVDETRLHTPEKLHFLSGIPIAHKDNLLTKGIKTTCSSKALVNFTPPYDATIVDNFKNAGMVMLGKVNLDEFAMGGSNENSYFGPCFNPWDTNRVPGGSSGGSAALLAARLSPAATGSDTGGSIRQPAAFCGITGIKPSYGVVSRYGMIAFASSLDQGGPMSKSAEDCAHLLSAMASFDPKHDMTSVQQPCYDYTKDLDKSLKSLRVGLPKEYFSGDLDPEIAQILQKAIDEYAKLGVTFIEVDLPDTKHCVPAYYTIAPCEASSNLARFDANLYGYRSSNAADLEKMYAQSRSESFGREVKRRILIGTYALSSGYYDDYYIKSQNIRNLIRHDFHEAFKKVDVIFAPTTPSIAFKIGQLTSDPVQMYLQDAFTIPVNLAELPSIALPVGMLQGMPVGMQIIGPRFTESRLLNAAHQYQKRTDWHLQCPNDFT